MNRILTLLLTAFIIGFPSESISRSEKIQVGTPSDYGVVERFFGDADCFLYFPVAYLYDIENQRFLSYSESVEALPEQYKLFKEQQCNFNVTNALVADALGLNWTKSHELAVLFFDPPPELARFMFREKDNIYERNLRIFENIEDLSLYKIKVPFKGFNPQR